MLRRHRRRRATTAVPGFATGGRTGSRPTRPRPLLCSSASNCENELEVGTAAQLGETERELLLRTDAEVAIGCWSQSAPEISAIFFFSPPRPRQAQPADNAQGAAPPRAKAKRHASTNSVRPGAYARPGSFDGRDPARPGCCFRPERAVSGGRDQTTALPLYQPRRAAPELAERRRVS